MSYNFMSNIANFSDVTNPDKSFVEVEENTEIEFFDRNLIKHKASFLMIRAGYDDDFLIELQPSSYCVYVPAGEMWSVDSIGEIEKFVIKKIFNSDGEEQSSGKIQWMMGYK